MLSHLTIFGTRTATAERGQGGGRFVLWLFHLDVGLLSLRPQTNTTSALAVARLTTRRCAARFGPSDLKARSFYGLLS